MKWIFRTFIGAWVLALYFVAVGLAHYPSSEELDRMVAEQKERDARYNSHQIKKLSEELNEEIADQQAKRRYRTLLKELVP